MDPEHGTHAPSGYDEDGPGGMDSFDDGTDH